MPKASRSGHGARIPPTKQVRALNAMNLDLQKSSSSSSSCSSPIFLNYRLGCATAAVQKNAAGLIIPAARHIRSFQRNPPFPPLCLASVTNRRSPGHSQVKSPVKARPLPGSGCLP